jgi:hypothetical protein
LIGVTLIFAAVVYLVDHGAIAGAKVVALGGGDPAIGGITFFGVDHAFILAADRFGIVSVDGAAGQAFRNARFDLLPALRKGALALVPVIVERLVG